MHLCLEYCSESFFDTLTDFAFSKDCQLGEKRVYQKLKKESVCYNGRKHEAQQNAKTCECTKYDYKCDFGYKRSKGLISDVPIWPKSFVEIILEKT